MLSMFTTGTDLTFRRKNRMVTFSPSPHTELPAPYGIDGPAHDA